MQTIFENIGFKITGEDDVFKLADFVLSAGKVLPVGDGAYAAWIDASGSAVWLRIALDHEKGMSELVNIDPHFQGSTVLRLRVRESMENEADDFLDGKYILENADGSMFLPVRIMGSKALREFEVGKEYDFQICMIPHAIRFFENEEAYRAYYNDGKSILGSVFPRGVYSRRLVQDENAQAEDVLITNIVAPVEHGELRHIEYAGDENVIGKYIHIRVKTLIGEIDIPCAIEEDEFEYIDRCLQGGQAVVSAVGVFSATVFARKNEGVE